MIDTSRFNCGYTYSNGETEYCLYVGEGDEYLLAVDGKPIPAGAEVTGGRYPNQTGLKILHALWEASGGYVLKSTLIERIPKQRTNFHGKNNPDARIKTQLTYLRHFFRNPRLIECRSGEGNDETSYRFNGVARKFRVKQNATEPSGLPVLPSGLPATAAQLEGPGGAMEVDSTFYVERECDGLAVSALDQQNFTMAIKGPRQVGKSSLLIRVRDAALKRGKRVAYLDFQTFDEDAFSDINSFLIQFSSALSYEVGLEDKVNEYWPSPAGNKNACRRYVKEHILKKLDAPLVLLLDEVDMIFHTSFCNDFFGMLRSWHNERARNPEFRRLDLAIVTSTEPKLFISDPNQSPFNVAEPKIEPEDFTPPELEELNRRYGSPLNEEEEEAVFMLLGGHPYLTRLFLHHVVTGRHTFASLLASASDDDGPFADHLGRLLSLLIMKNDMNLGQVYLGVIKSGMYPREEIFNRLKGAGLVRDAARWTQILARYFPGRKHPAGEVGAILPRCQLYATYFRRCLNA